ncbi:Hepatic triacylglycerol lipase [Lamellibrachia satsuma]|nr:Hepatic triacylglycerol lipase [Lamellibrachia satsuma]
MSLNKLRWEQSSVKIHFSEISGEAMVVCVQVLIRLGPLFRRNTAAGLTRGSGDFVDAIHTDGRVFGMMTPIGHVDFYPNGGKTQPGCKFPKRHLCSHRRVLDLFRDTVVGKSKCYTHQKCSSHNNIPTTSPTKKLNNPLAGMTEIYLVCLQRFGHVMTSTGLFKTILQGAVSGGRGRGRVGNIKEWTGLSSDIILVQQAQYSPLPLRLVDYLVPSQCDEGPSEVEKH